MQAQLFDRLPVAKGAVELSRPNGCAADLMEVIQRQGWAFLKVSGKSMSPWIREGDVVFLRRSGMNEIVRGDVVVFEKSGLLCVHRVLTVKENSVQGFPQIILLTKGDATVDADAPVSATEFFGKVEFLYRRNKEISLSTGWRKYFAKALAFISPATAWWKPILSALMAGVTAE